MCVCMCVCVCVLAVNSDEEKAPKNWLPAGRLPKKVVPSPCPPPPPIPPLPMEVCLSV